ncbi:hypothetical protein [Kribbella solani]|uniref:O-antigen/teichoic acid export membrane protein n=1 Tax=Kribbella solani TaxID=236067 RepID=A0A841E2Y9_9ACTN|nr:hypothetical protein [Kribbella solani]MBB5982757.1 O-antigen/teichoic acid export membrane protein [Kribbella solani]MDX2969799.1 hypothetical protein [Kribbella solani]MDX3000957.1 hypothetical protein [Kribbella solani]
MRVTELGALCFGVVVGWVTYRTLIRRTDRAALTDISAVIAAVGGGAVTGLFKSPTLFAWYSIGLAGGFVMYFVLFWIFNGNKKLGEVMGGSKASGDRDF